ncbi:hypothetical protein [Confluentibacter citreus]|uniref:hypothetical protein n=1 Tax=Confluentibacter citreus TaxID=2007307 RepID=UPI0012FD26DF|nr:hypothetical protein [Confluentibacter citreus]
MGRITTVTTKYRFIKPTMLTLEEYNSYKQILKIDPWYKIGPKDEFWKEFSTIKWLLIVFILSFLIGIITDLEFLGIIGFLCFAFLLLILFMGEGSSMISYSKYQNSKNEYFENLKRNINESKSYEEFIIMNSRM